MLQMVMVDRARMKQMLYINDLRLANVGRTSVFALWRPAQFGEPIEG